MSWSRAISGTSDEVKAAMSLWSDEQAGYDRNLPFAAQNGHQQQINAAVASVTRFLEGIPAGRRVNGSAWGHHNGDESTASFGLRVGTALNPSSE